MRVSDYDLMSLLRQAGAGWRKVFASAADGAPRGTVFARGHGHYQRAQPMPRVSDSAWLPGRLLLSTKSRGQHDRPFYRVLQ